MITGMKVLRPSRQFICDDCGKIIKSPKEGWVEFLSEPNGIGRRYFDFRLVHASPQRDCLNHFYRADGGSIEIDQLTGSKGIIELLDLLDEGDVFDRSCRDTSIKSMREFTELFRRLQVPYYEQARQYWHQALSEGWFEENNLDGIYGEKTLKNLIADYSLLPEAITKATLLV
jgi:hypothetical protein